MRKDKADAEDRAKATNSSIAVTDRPANGLPEDLRDHARLVLAGGPGGSLETGRTVNCLNESEEKRQMPVCICRRWIDSA